MPEGTDGEDVELVEGFTFNATSLVDSFSEPLLNAHVPVVYFLPDVGSCLYN